MGGQIIDASIEAVIKARRRNGDEALREDKPAKRYRIVEARCTQKHGKSHYCRYKNYVNVAVGTSWSAIM